jgi:hypothetical protein
MVVSFLFFAIPVAASAPIDFDLNTRQGVRDYIALEAQKQAVEPSLPTRIVQLESQFTVGAIGDSGLAHCVAQFHEETFYRMARLSGENPMYKWGDERACVRLLIWGLKNGHGSEWSTYKNAKPSVR